MVKKLKVLYRSVGSKDIKFIEGLPKAGIHDGFVFSNFKKNKTFTIKPEVYQSISSKELLDLSFVTKKETNWESTLREDYEFGFSIIKNEIDHNKINKAILSRKKVKNQKVNLKELFLNLCENYISSHIFLIETPEGEVWIGATPETLMEKKENGYETMSLAGTKESNEADWTEKEFSEQRIVTNAILGELFKFNINPDVGKLETVKAGAVYHLRNRIKFDTKESTLTIANALHPTPAISGNPKEQAISTIKIAENHNRDYYCGFGGIVQNGEIENLFVNLRCANVSSNQICLYVGGGITKDSELSKEWAECDRKATSLLRFL
jgi:isochorismate synthase